MKATSLICTGLLFLSACVKSTPVTATTNTALPPKSTPPATSIALPAPTNITPAVGCEISQSWKMDFQRTGGIAGLAQQILVDSHGNVTANDFRKNKLFTSSLSKGQVTKLANLLNQACPFETIRPSGGCADCFNYVLIVETNGKQFRVNATDISMPESVKPLFQELSLLLQTTIH